MNVILKSGFSAACRWALVVDDELISRTLTTTLLMKLGFSVAEAKHGREALAALRRGAFDIVVMDVEMPVMDGLETCRRIRRGEAGDAGIPVIALSSSGRRLEGLLAGMDAFVEKPASKEKLAQAVALILPERSWREAC